LGNGWEGGSVVPAGTVVGDSVGGNAMLEGLRILEWCK